MRLDKAQGELPARPEIGTGADKAEQGNVDGNRIITSWPPGEIILCAVRVPQKIGVVPPRPEGSKWERTPLALEKNPWMPCHNHVMTGGFQRGIQLPG
jgi:hypothetical protein